MRIRAITGKKQEKKGNSKMGYILCSIDTCYFKFSFYFCIINEKIIYYKQNMKLPRRMQNFYD